MMRFLVVCLAALAVSAAVLILALALGGPGVPGALPGINNPFKDVDRSGMPGLEGYPARDGAVLAYRAYPVRDGAARGTVVLLHGSSAHSASLHPLAKALAAAGFTAYALDVRGHGASGTRGLIDHIGQLEDDLEDFLDAVRPARPLILAGFSSGGGFALRFAASDRQRRFDSYLLLSPFLGPRARTTRPGSGGWVKVGVPRLVAIGVLNGFGVRAANQLPVLRFALDPDVQANLTPWYGFDLAVNYGPPRDLQAGIRAMGQPVRLIAGQEDDVFWADRFESVFRDAGKPIPVTLVPGTAHVTLTLAPAAVAAVVEQVRTLAGPG
jgi:alpha-beta hydrolase superfamily lysophospholipase